MPKISMERFKDSLILCSHCKRYLPRESFFEWQLRKGKYDCKECHRKYVNEYNHRHGMKSKEEQRREHEEKELLENPFGRNKFDNCKSSKELRRISRKERLCLWLL